MRRAMEYAYSLQLPVISHCEDTNLSGGGLMNEGYYSTILGLSGIPGIAEEAMVARDILIAEFTNTCVHIAHVSTAGSVRLIRDAKKRGLKVTAETAPHYFTLTDEALQSYDTNFKVNPPLRSEQDVAAIKEGFPTERLMSLPATMLLTDARIKKWSLNMPPMESAVGNFAGSEPESYPKQNAELAGTNRQNER
jgi:dihydroorotase-like cyclic amidohydrolase